MTEPRYPRNLNHLARYINQPLFPIALRRFLFHHNHSDLEQAPANIEDLPSFEGEIKVYHSAIATYYAPSDICGAGGLHREFIRSTPSFHGHERRDTVFVVLDESKKGMEGMEIGRVLLFFSFQYRRKTSRAHWSIGLFMMTSLTVILACGPCRWSMIGMDSQPLKLSMLIPLLEEHIYCLFMVLHGFPMIGLVSVYARILQFQPIIFAY